MQTVSEHLSIGRFLWSRRIASTLWPTNKRKMYAIFQDQQIQGWTDNLPAVLLFAAGCFSCWLATALLDSSPSLFASASGVSSDLGVSSADGTFQALSRALWALASSSSAISSLLRLGQQLPQSHTSHIKRQPKFRCSSGVHWTKNPLISVLAFLDQ